MCLSTDGGPAVTKKEKPASKSVVAGKIAASWQQIVEYNASQKTVDKSVTNTSAVEGTDESKNVISDNKNEVCSLSVKVSSADGDSKSVDNRTFAGNADSFLDTGEDGQRIVSVTAKSRSAQDLSKQAEMLSAHRRSTESLPKDHSGTLPSLERLRRNDVKRRSFSGAFHKAASAVAIRYRGVRDSFKAVSAEWKPKLDKTSLNELSQPTEQG